MQKDNELIQPWLKEQKSTSTKHSYLNNISHFQKWWNKPLAKFLQLPPEKMRHQALEYQDYLKNELHRNINTIIAFLTALQSFCASNCKPLLLRRKRLQIQIDVRSHIFTNGDLIRCFDVANVEQKAILSTMVSLGWEVSAVLELDKNFISALIKSAKEEGQKFIYFKGQRQKTGALRLGVLNPLCIEWIGKWLDDPRCVGPSLFSYHTKEGINGMLKHLARDAHLTLRGSVHTHQIRKWVMSGLSRARFNAFQIKYLMGKTIPSSDATYLQTLQQEIEEYYPEAYENYLSVRPVKIVQIVDEDMKAKVATLERENTDLKDKMQERGDLKARVELENTDLKRRISSTEQKLSNIEKMIQELKKQVSPPRHMQ
jgi:hypothetical protein